MSALQEVCIVAATNRQPVCLSKCLSVYEADYSKQRQFSHFKQTIGKMSCWRGGGGGRERVIEGRLGFEAEANKVSQDKKKLQVEGFRHGVSETGEWSASFGFANCDPTTSLCSPIFLPETCHVALSSDVIEFGRGKWGCRGRILSLCQVS